MQWKRADEAELEALAQSKWDEAVEKKLFEGYIKPGMTKDML